MAKHEYYAVQGKTLDNIAGTMKTVLGVDKDTPIRFDEITNNEKAEQVTESVDVQAGVIEQIKVALNGKSSIGVKEIMNIIDQSGVLDSTDGTATEKVEQLIDRAEWEKVWYKHTETMTSVTGLFAKFQGKTIPRTNLISLTSMHSFLSEAPNIEYIDYYLNTEQATNFTYCFRHCAALKWIVGVNTSSATNVGGMFFGCSSLETIQQPLDFSKVTYIGNAFQSVRALKDIRFVPESIKISITFESKNLSNESKQSIFDGLAPVTTAQTLTLYSGLKILQSQVDSANAKGWTVAGGTVVSEEEYYG